MDVGTFRMVVFSGASAREARQGSTMGKKNWQPIKPSKFVYDVSVRASERMSVRTSVQTLGEGEGRLEIFLTVTCTRN